MRVFVSYSHHDAHWVRSELCACLEAGGAEVLVDHRAFEAGRSVLGQMDGLQDQADKHVLVLSESYLASSYCQHELKRALASDPNCQQGRVIPVRRSGEHQTWPEPLRIANPLHVDLRPETAQTPEPWALLLQACGANLGCPAPAWLRARRELIEYLARLDSVNLVIRGPAKWRPLINTVHNSLKEAHSARNLGTVDLDSGVTASRRGLLEEILNAAGAATTLSPAPAGEDLVAFSRTLKRRDQPALLALLHFDRVTTPERQYGADLFRALRDLISNERKLCVLIHSKKPFLELLPDGHVLSSLTQLKLVELG